MKTKPRAGETGNYNAATVAGDEGGIRLGRYYGLVGDVDVANVRSQ